MNAQPESLDPVAVLSFPKTGRTWLKLMLKSYFERVFEVDDLPFDGHAQWHRRDAQIPPLCVEHDDDPHFKAPDEMHRRRPRFAEHRVVFLVRDPRDVMVSLFYEMTRRGKFYEDWGFDTSRVRADAENISTFIRGPVGRLASLIAYWRIWDDQRHHVRAFTLVRYEDLHGDAAGELARLLEFMGIAVDPAAVTAVVEQCQFDRMRRREEQGDFDSKTLRPADPDDPESFKVRRGVVGGFADELSEDDVAWIDAQVAELPELFASYRSTR